MSRLFLIAAVAVLIPFAASAGGILLPNPSGYYMTNQMANQTDPFWGMLAQQRANEAIINEMRRARGAPPCSLNALRAALIGRPVCD
jgi:hypothetical protein